MEYKLISKNASGLEQTSTFTVNNKEEEIALYLRHDQVGMVEKKSDYGYGFGAGVLVSALISTLWFLIALVTAVLT